MATFNPTIIAFVVGMVSKHVRQQDKDVEVTHVVIKHTLWINTIPFRTNFSMPDFKMFNGAENRLPTFY